VAKDPHLSLTSRNRYLYVPSQDGNIVQIFDRFTMAPVTTVDVPSAHGAGMTKSGRFFYTTNLTGGGTDAIWTIGTRTNSVVGEPVDAPYAVPHNIAISQNGKRLFVTHSGGSSDKVTFYRISNHHPNPVYLGEATVGLNPFGLAFAP
jgi:DNA-binding beta-propeller fold protein YncE